MSFKTVITNPGRAQRVAATRMQFLDIGSVYLNPDQVASMTRSELYAVLGIDPRGFFFDQDQVETTETLDRAVLTCREPQRMAA